MWYLGAFDKESEILVRDYPLIGLDTATLKDLLEFGDSYEIDGIQYPPEAGGYDVPLSILPRLTKYIVGDFAVDSSCDYQVEYYRD
ncbi:DUF7683 domain-containing protein [Nocardia amamiensis]|uniref:DUF7683 domain-containing protein n=1 Tax=Nocardia amamiensis TaxID=404578 RepID=UPI000A9079D3